MKPFLEKIPKAQENSIIIKQISHENSEPKRFPWHFHEEMELLYIRGGTGKRIVGNHISDFEKGELILMGPNLPHSGFTDINTNHQMQTIVHFRKEIFQKKAFNFPEIQFIQRLLEEANLGISFQNPIKDLIGMKVESLNELNGFKRFLLLFEILGDLANTENKMILNKRNTAAIYNKKDSERMNRLLSFISKNYKKQISIKEIASEASMTDAAFCRYFKIMTGQSFTNYLNDFRIQTACKLIQQGNLKLKDIAFNCGYNSFTYFFRIFKKIVGKSPSEYRRSFIELSR